MFDDPVRKIMLKRNFVTASPATAVDKAAQLMASRNVGAILVVQDERLVGIITERDIAFRVVARALDPRTTPISAVMTGSPVTIDDDRPFGYALAVMHRHGFRHLPVVKDGLPVGIISARAALDPDLEEFAAETSRRRHFDAMV